MNFSLDNGKELSVETPVVTNIIPILGAGLGYAVGKLLNKTDQTSILYAVVGFGIGVIPKVYYYTKAINDFKKETANQSKNEEFKKELDNYDEDNAPVSTDTIITFLKKITSENNLLHNFLPKEKYFYDVIDNFPQKDKDILYSLLVNIDKMPSEPNEEDITSFSQSIFEMEKEYGKDDVDRVNLKLNEINNYLNETLEPQVAAA
jgi:LPS O-antigen subunit length determinant protein (WzzB/FepE family)